MKGYIEALAILGGTYAGVLVIAVISSKFFGLLVASGVHIRF